MSASEADHIKQLRTELGDLEINQQRFGSGNEFLAGWLRVKKNNIKNTAEAIRKYMKYRADNKLDTIETWAPSVKGELQYEMCGYEENGCPVFYIPWGTWNMKKLEELGRGVEADIRFKQIFELAERQVVQQTVALKREVAGFVFMVDMTGFSLKQLMSKKVIRRILALTKTIDEFHATFLKTDHICNAPITFPHLWKITMPFMKADLQNKLQIHSSKSTLLATLEKNQIPAACIPTVLGGNYKLKFDVSTKGGDRRLSLMPTAVYFEEEEEAIKLFEEIAEEPDPSA